MRFDVSKKAQRSLLRAYVKVMAVLGKKFRMEDSDYDEEFEYSDFDYEAFIVFINGFNNVSIHKGVVGFN